MKTYNNMPAIKKNKISNSKLAFGCTSLRTKDKQGNIYHGRTLEYSTDSVTQVIYYPVGSLFSHKAPDCKSEGLAYKTQYELLFVSTPANDGISIPLEGINSEGLSASLNMKTDSDLPELTTDMFATSLHWAFLIEWALSNCKSVEEIKSYIQNISIWTGDQLGYPATNHFIFYDTTGACLVVEISNNKLHLIDNTTGVMTNGPEFSWHLTNLNNYTFLTNEDISESTLGGLHIKQPDTGIAASLLPSSDTAVGRFIRAVFYTTFAQIEDTPQKAMIELSHIMNKFDRPKNITRSTSGEGGDIGSSSEYTVWTSLTNLQAKEIYIRTYYELDYKKYTMQELAKLKKIVIIDILK